MKQAFSNRIKPDEMQIIESYITCCPVKIAGLAQALGLDVYVAPLPPKVSGFIRPSEKSPSGFEIHVNKFEAKYRQRYTVAHEISHYLLHRDSINSGIYDNIMYRSSLTSSKEVEANKFAAEIIMPRDVIIKEFHKLKKNGSYDIIKDMAKLFQVSESAMKIRVGV